MRQKENSLKMEMDRRENVYTHSEILFSLEKENPISCDRDETGRYRMTE